MRARNRVGICTKTPMCRAQRTEWHRENPPLSAPKPRRTAAGNSKHRQQQAPHPDFPLGRVKIACEKELSLVQVWTGYSFETVAAWPLREDAELSAKRIRTAIRETVMTDRGIASDAQPATLHGTES